MSRTPTVITGAVDTLTRDEGGGASNVKDQLDNYVRTQYPKLTKQNATFTSIPVKPEEKLDMSDKGDKAEFDVFERLKNINIPGLCMTVFSGSYYVGQKAEATSLIAREVDLGVFLRY